MARIVSRSPFRMTKVFIGIFYLKVKFGKRVFTDFTQMTDAKTDRNLIFDARAVRENWFSGCIHFFELATRKPCVKG